MEQVGSFLILILIGMFIAVPSVFVGFMAGKRGRGYFTWFFISLFFSFIVAIILLLLLGDTEERRREKILEDEELRRSYRESQNNFLD